MQLPAPASSLAVPPPAAIHRFSYRHVRGIVLLLYPAYCVACFVLWNRMDVHINTIILRLHPTRGSPNDICLVANAWYNCATRYDMRSEIGISAQEKPPGKKRQVVYNFGPAAGPAGHESGPPAGTCKFANRRIRGPDPRVRSAGQPKTTSWSWLPNP